MQNRKQNNYHRAHPEECERCGRRLPKKAYRNVCATCLKFSKQLVNALVKAGAQEIEVA